MNTLLKRFNREAERATCGSRPLEPAFGGCKGAAFQAQRKVFAPHAPFEIKKESEIVPDPICFLC